jgi:predicted DNA-binding transcriptional regulator YafY
MLDTSARLLRLLSLLQVQPAWPGAELARRLEITPRTLRRDVQRLRDLGYPVHATPGVAGGYRLGAGAALPPLLLDDDEAVAVAVSLRTAASQTVTGVAEASLRALAKLEQVLPGRLRERTAALQQAMVTLPRTAPAVDPELLMTLARACRSRQALRFGYRSRDGELSQRQAEPHRLVHTGYRWYLVARDTGRDD